MPTQHNLNNIDTDGKINEALNFQDWLKVARINLTRSEISLGRN